MPDIASLEKMTVEDLAAHIAEAQTILNRKREEARAAFIAETRQKAEKLGIPLRDLFGEPTEKLAKTRAKSAKPDAERKVAAKYRDPENAENAWTGRGMMPRWIRERIEAGAKKEDFLIVQ